MKLKQALSRFLTSGLNKPGFNYFGMKIFLITFLLLSSLLPCIGYANTPPPPQTRVKSVVEQIFSTIEDGVRDGDISKFTDFFSNQTYLSLASGYNGYCSANQAYYILQNYFKLHQPVNFKFTTVSDNKNPYATGIYTYELKNRRGTSQVFISLKQANNRWLISQFTVR